VLIDKMAQAFAGSGIVTFKKSNTPAIGMVVGAAAALGKAGQAESQAGWQVAVHSK
jgi:hypothetical protein